MEKNDNCFNIIRHIAAFSVLFSHNFSLSGLHEPTIRGWESIGFISVVVFFALSGFLMPRSFYSSGNFMVFMSKRIRRISPGLISCSFLMLFVIYPIYTYNNITSIDWIFDSAKLLVQHSVFIFNDPKNVFDNFIVPNAMNGSLWTLPIEFACYIIIGALLSFANNYKSILLILSAAFIGCITMKYNSYAFFFFGIPLHYISTFGIAFFFGALLSMTINAWVNYKKILFIISIFVFISAKNSLEMYSIGVMALTLLTLIIGLSIKSNKSNNIDISYGVYIYAFPVQQIVINTISNDFLVSLILSAFITTAIAFVSYKYIEEPFLRGEWPLTGKPIKLTD